MDVATVLIELAEKMGLIAAAAVVAVLLPPLRNRLLGVGQPRDQLTAIVLGLGLSIWGAMLGFQVMGEHMNVRAIGVLIAAILGGWKAGLVAGIGGGLFYAARVDDTTAPWVLAASIIDGLMAGVLAERRPLWFQPKRVFFTSIGIQAFHLAIVGAGLLVVGHAARYLPAWPAHLAKLIVNAAGVMLFVLVAKLVVAREESAIALIEARAAADAARLESLRRRLEPHFLFNALNALRATIRTSPERARELVADLSDLYRYLLAHPEDATVREEVAHATSYLEIERARLGDERLRVRADVAEEVSGAVVPALLLQPLVENAVKHGVATREGPGEVLLRASDHDGTLVLSVEDRGTGRRVPLSEAGSGIALETLRTRLERRYGATASISLDVRDDGARAEVRLPLSMAATASTGRSAA